MHWLKANWENLSKLRTGTVCWVFSADLNKCMAAVYRPTEQRWACHGQEHFSVTGVTKFIVLPSK